MKDKPKAPKRLRKLFVNGKAGRDGGRWKAARQAKNASRQAWAA